jgi:nucleoside diphosphate kinase
VTEWDSHVFCMIAPDALRRHLAGAILDRFDAVGLRPAGWRLAELGSMQIDTMHELAVVRSTQAYRYRCLDALFALGPCLLLCLEDVKPHRGDPYARALQTKGASDPRHAKPGSIRHDLHAINLVMSLLHTSDGPAESVAESAVLLAGVPRPQWWREPNELSGLLAVIEAGTPERRLFNDVVAGVRARVVSRLWTALDVEARSMAGRLAAAGELGEDHAGEKIARVANCGEDPLLGVLASRFDSAGDLRETVRALHGVGIELDGWEQAVLGTSMYFPVNR